MPSALQRQLLRLATGEAASALVAPVLHRIDVPLLRLTHGRASITRALTGLPVFLVEMRGARSGRLRRTPLVLLAHGRAWVAIASSFGRPRHPAWYHNLTRNPECSIWLDGRPQPFRARPALGAEREQHWDRAVALYAGFEKYRLRASERQIPVLVLEPVEA